VPTVPVIFICPVVGFALSDKFSLFSAATTLRVIFAASILLAPLSKTESVFIVNFSLLFNSKPPLLTVISVSIKFTPPALSVLSESCSNLFVPVNSITPAPLVLNDMPEVLVLTASFM